MAFREELMRELHMPAAGNRREKKGDLHSTCHLTGTVSPSKSTRRERTCETRAAVVVRLPAIQLPDWATFMAK